MFLGCQNEKPDEEKHGTLQKHKEVAGDEEGQATHDSNFYPPQHL